MPIRIYALAKELQIDNKKLVDICTRAGITGKGSALASLTDEEVVRLKAFMAGGKGGGSPRTAAAGTGRSIRREDYIAPTGTAVGSKVPVLPAKQDKPPRAAEGPRKKAEETAAPVRPVVEVPPVAAAPVAPVLEATSPIEPEHGAPAAVAPPVVVAESPAPPSPESPAVAEADQALVTPPPAAVPAPPPPRATIGPVPSRTPQRTLMPSLSRPLERLLGKRAQDKQPGEKQAPEKKAGEKRSGEKSAPAMHLAPMPTPSKSIGKNRPKEPTPQKPDIKLPPDAIRAGKAGSKPLSEHLRKHEEKKKRDDLAAKKGTPRSGPAEPGTGVAPPADLAGGKERPRRAPGKPGAAEDEREGAGLATLGGREQRQAKRKRSTTAKRRGSGEDEEGSTGAARRSRNLRRTGTNTAAPAKARSSWNCPAPSALSPKPPEYPKARSSASCCRWGS